MAEEPTSSSAGVLADEHAPDLRALPAFSVGLNDKGTAMRFGATVWNGGARPDGRSRASATTGRSTT